MANQILIEKDGAEIVVSEKTFNLIYAPAGYTAIGEPFEPTSPDENESETDVDESVVADAIAPVDSGQGSRAVGSGTRKANKAKILSGPKTGKIYRLGSSKRKFVRVHRASRRGESPASSTGSLLNSIRAKKLGFMSVRVATSKRYALRLDSKQGLDRPFFASTAQEFKAKFKQNIREAIAAKS